MVQARILLVDDEASLRKVLAASLRKEGYDVISVKNGEEAIEVLRASEQPDTGDPFDLIITDLRMPGVSGMDLLSHATQHYKDVPVVMLTAYGTVDLAVQALKKGAFDFISKPYERDELISVVKKAIAQRERDAHETRGAVATVDEESEETQDNDKPLVGKSGKMRQILDVINKVADSPSTVLITGESGTGKELVATALHRNSSRRDKPFIRINCAAIPPTLIEAELFGYEKGAFTGAVNSKPGRFELAHTGTLFLDEIGELSTDMQVKLLRVLQEGTFERVGGIRTMQIDVRLIAATNRDLAKSILAGEFRDDLYYRLNVVPIVLPPLRDRLEDIPVLVGHFVKKHSKRLNRTIDRFTDEAMRFLTAYPWPGNIRELENIVERTLLFASRLLIDVEDLPPEIVEKARPSLLEKAAINSANNTNSSTPHTSTTTINPVVNSPEAATGMAAHTQNTSSSVELSDGNDGTDSSDVNDAADLSEGLAKDASMKDIVRHAMAELERDLILRALEETENNVTHAARRLKISRKSLQIKMKELGIRDELLRAEENASVDKK